MWRGDVGSAYLFTAPFGWRCLTSRAVLRFHIPLVEPDVRFPRIRLSDKASHAFAHGKLVVCDWRCTSPSAWCRYSSGKRDVPCPGTLCLRHSH